MADFPVDSVSPPKVAISALGSQSGVGFALLASTTTVAAAVWPVASTAFFLPVMIETPVLAQQMGCTVATQSGNIDVGIYSEKGAKIVTKGTTAVGTAGLQVFANTDTLLNPGVYFLAMAVDNTTASFNRCALSTTNVTVCGVQQMASAFVLPATATFANPTSAYQPSLTLFCTAAAI
jgi:hypothetical protein